MHYDLLNNSDLYVLKCRRIERFRGLFLEICGTDYKSAILCPTLDNNLIIRCGNKVGVLILNIKEVLDTASIVLGISTLAVYQNTQLVYFMNILEEISNKKTMTVAVEKDTVDPTTELSFNGETQSNANIVTPKITKSLALTDIAADLDAKIEDIYSFLVERDGALIDFKGTIIVPESTAAIAYEHYSLLRARQKMQERFAASLIDEIPHKDPHVKPKKPNSLVFKSEFKVFRSNYKRTVQNFLNAMFPGDEEKQKQALSDMTQPTELGGAYFDKIIRAGDYKDFQHARDLLYKAAAELQQAGRFGHG